jgi:hypothetical protein
MQKLVITVVTAAVFTSAAFAQNPPSGSATTQGSTSAQTGEAANASSNTQTAGAINGSANGANAAAVQSATLGAVLSKSIDAKKAKVGDEVTAKTMADATTSAGTKIPKNTKLVGHVTEAKAKSKGEAQSTLGFVFDKAVLKSGQEVPLHAVVQAVEAAPQPALNTGTEASSETPMTPSNMGSQGSMGSRSENGGLVGGAANTAANATNSAAGAVQSATNAAGAAANNAGQTVANSSGALTSTSTGVIGIKDLQLQQAANGSASAATGSGSGSVPVLTSTKGNVKLESGTQLVLKSSSASANAGVGASTSQQ